MTNGTATYLHPDAQQDALTAQQLQLQSAQQNELTVQQLQQNASTNGPNPNSGEGAVEYIIVPSDTEPSSDDNNVSPL
jgi:hypothetical protein